jgi:putative pyruvate formate lyase activating enzyme
MLFRGDEIVEPSYIRLYSEGELQNRLEKALGLLKSCTLCPRKCGSNRLAGETGVCRIGRVAKVSSYNTHFGEEAPLVGRFGSGTIFLTSCNLLCSFCQNYDISHLAEGVEEESEQMADMMVDLADRGCQNINFVTPTHVIPQIIEALILAIEKGLRVPLVYNSGGYDRKETLELLDGIFDIYMPDFKFWENKWADRFCSAPDYQEVAQGALKEMHRQVGDLVMDNDGTALRGLIVRHLVMPGDVGGTKEVMGFLSKEISKNTYVNLMDQYRPCGKADQDGFINRRITGQEFREAVNSAKKAGLVRLDPRDRPSLVFQI